MRIGIIPGVLGMLCTTLSVHAQKPDSVRNVALPEVVLWISVRDSPSR